MENMNKKVLAWCGVLAPIVFIVSLVIFSLFTPGYSNLTNAVSELGTLGAPFAFAWNILGFLLVGLLIIAFAWGMYLDFRQSTGGIVVPILVGISGIGFAGLGLFPAEAGFEPSTRTTLHFTMVSINFLPFVLVAFIFAIRLKANEYWKTWTLFSAVMGVLAVASFFIPKNIPVGLSQRVGMGAYFLWLFVTSLALLRKPTDVKS
jgi:hypothetical membrane protein